MTRKRVLVTGGAGFLGSHLCDALLRRGDEVLCVDNFFTGTRQNIAELLKYPNFEVIRHDVNFPLHVEVDEIYCLACPASPLHYQFDPVQTTKTSVIGSINMLGLAKRVKAKILLTSTSEIYGDPAVHPKAENYHGNVNPYGPRACYDEGKRCAETLFYDYNRQHGMPIRIARVFNTYGPGMDAKGGPVVSRFILQALRGEPVTVFGGGQSRTFCYVDDMVGGLLRLMDVNDASPGPVNLGSTAEITILDLARLIIALTNSSSEIAFRPQPPDDPDRRCPDIGKAERMLGWRPCVALSAGLMRTIEYFERSLGLRTAIGQPPITAGGIEGYASPRPARSVAARRACG
jgi:UDP-glucuronate decarboxylase